MATTKRRTTTSTKNKVQSRKQAENLAARTGRTIKQQPYVSAAIATGAVTAVAAAVAGAFFFRRSGKSVSELTGDLSETVKDGFSDVRGRVADGARTIKEKAAFLLGEDDDDQPTQSEIAEEALTLKETGRKASRPVDDIAAQNIKAGAIAY